MGIQHGNLGVLFLKVGKRKRAIWHFKKSLTLLRTVDATRQIKLVEGMLNET